MRIVKCLNCGKISTSEIEVICLRCNSDLAASRFAAATIQKAPLSLPYGLSITKLVAAVLLLIAGFVVLNFLLSLKAERARMSEVKRQMQMAAKFDNIRFDNDPAAIENAFKLIPAKFRIDPPEFESFKADLAAEASKKDRQGYSSEWRQNGTYDYEYQLPPAYRQSGGVEQFGNTRLETGRQHHRGVSVPMRSYEKVETVHRHRFVVLDVNVTDFNYVKAPGDKLVCFVKYTVRTAQFSSSSEEGSPGDSRRAEMARGIKVKDWTATENARYEREQDRWAIKESGISELGKLRQIDELKASAAAAQLPVQTQP